VRSSLSSPAKIDDIVQNFRKDDGGRATLGGMKFATGCMRVALLAQTLFISRR
jgi:hypothetical protein